MKRVQRLDIAEKVADACLRAYGEEPKIELTYAELKALLRRAAETAIVLGIGDAEEGDE